MQYPKNLRAANIARQSALYFGKLAEAAELAAGFAKLEPKQQAKALKKQAKAEAKAAAAKLAKKQAKAYYPISKAGLKPEQAEAAADLDRAAKDIYLSSEQYKINQAAKLAAAAEAIAKKAAAAKAEAANKAAELAAKEAAKIKFWAEIAEIYIADKL